LSISLEPITTKCYQAQNHKPFYFRQILIAPSSYISRVRASATTRNLRPPAGGRFRLPVFHKCQFYKLFLVSGLPLAVGGLVSINRASFNQLGKGAQSFNPH
jgi:hypothetical protein